MELMLLDTSFVTIAVVDQFESMIWTDRYYECGDFEIVLPCTKANIAMFQKGYYLYLKSSDRLMIIEGIAIDSDVENGDKMTVSGRSLESILDRRIIWNRISFENAKTQDVIKRLITDSIISPTDSSRRIPNFIFQDSTDETVLNSVCTNQYYGEVVYDAIVDILKLAGIGMKVTLNDNNQFVFQLYSGVNRSYNQTKNQFVVFSHGFDNFLSSNFADTYKEFKNVCLVSYTQTDYDSESGESKEKVLTSTATSGDVTGLNRREMFIEGNVEQAATSDGEEQLTDAQIQSQLLEQGNTNLQNKSYTTSFEGECQYFGQFEYGRDFSIGDIVEVGDAYGNRGTSRITELVHSQDTTGEKIYPTFEAFNKEGKS